MEKVFKFEIKRVTLEEAGRVEKNGFSGKGFQKYFIRAGHEGYMLSDVIDQQLPQLYCMEIRPDDVFVITFPRSGTTWTQELVWLIANDFDFETAKTVRIDRRFPNLTPAAIVQNDFSRRMIQKTSEGDADLQNLGKSVQITGLDAISQMPSPRFIKTHLPLSLLPPGLIDKAKVVYVARDPRDVAVSYYHYFKFMTALGFKGEFKQFWTLFRNDSVEYGPYFAHFRESWEKRNHPNMLFLLYEELSKDMPDVIRRVAKFFGKTATETDIAKLCEHLDISNFRKNECVNKQELKTLGIIAKDGNYIRRGKAGGWRDYFDEEMKRDAQVWMEEGYKDINFNFPF